MGAEKYAIDLMAGAIEKLTGYRPPTCPWQAMYDPLVRPVIDAARLAGKNLGAWALDEDPPGILVDALGVYLRAREATKNHDDAEEHKEHLAKVRADQLKAKRGWGV